MKKSINIFLSVLMLCNILFTVSFAREPAKLIYTESFDNNLFDWPMGWSKIGNCEAWLETDKENGGKMLHLYDKSTEDAILACSPIIPAKPNTPYTVIADMKCTKTYIFIYIRYYKDNILIGNVSASEFESNIWNRNILYGKTPANANNIQIVLSTQLTTGGEGYVDNIELYEGILEFEEKYSFDPPKQEAPVDSKIISTDTGKLSYNPYNEEGDRLSDYSSAGFYGGEYELPDSNKLPLAAVLEPINDENADDTERIQNTIDYVYENSSNGDYFKVILLKAGRYNINEKGLNLKSGIILKGEGQGPDGTVLYETTSQTGKTVINVSGNAVAIRSKNAYITDKYVEAGSYDFSVEQSRISDYKVGDLIQVFHPSTDEWNKQMDMVGDGLPEGMSSWYEGGQTDYSFEREIVKIEGNKITVDIPFFVPMENVYSKPYIRKISDSGRLVHVGLENFRIDSQFDGTMTDENHAYNGILFSNAKDCYVKDVTTKHIVHSNFTTRIGAKRITFKNCSVLQPISLITGDRRYAFYAGKNSQQILFTGCYSYDGRHDYVGSYPCTGPIVFNDNVADESNQASETHGYFSTGVLFDNIMEIGNNTQGYIAFTNRGAYGIGYNQGWSSAGTVAWNCLSPYIGGQKPPMTYQNFIIGEWGLYDDEAAIGRREGYGKYAKNIYFVGSGKMPDDDAFFAKRDTSFSGNCYMESKNAPVNPGSIYRAQMAERYSGSYKKAKPSAPVIVSPISDKTLFTDEVTIRGLYRRGTKKVTLYIDNIPYDAELNEDDHTFQKTIRLNKGVHKIYATQTENGIEGTKCADRFIIIEESTGNFDYLSSDYNYDLIHHIYGDDIKSFDEYQNSLDLGNENAIIVKVNGNNLETEVPAVEINDRVYIPFRAIFDEFGMKVTYDEETKTATAKRDDQVTKITAGSDVLKLNDKEIKMDVVPLIIDGRFLIPVRFVAENNGAVVSWSEKRRTVNIDGGVVVYAPIHGFENELGIYRITQSGDDGAGHQIQNLFDGTPLEWSVHIDNSNGAYGIFDFGYKKDIKDVYIQFNFGTTRIYTFDILVSEDGENYIKILDKVSSSGETDDFEKFELNTSGRYIKIVGYGNSINGWNNYREMAFTEQAK